MVPISIISSKKRSIKSEYRNLEGNSDSQMRLKDFVIRHTGVYLYIQDVNFIFTNMLLNF